MATHAVPKRKQAAVKAPKSRAKIVGLHDYTPLAKSPGGFSRLVNQRQLLPMLVFIVVFAASGVYLLMLSRATPPPNSGDPAAPSVSLTTPANNTTATSPPEDANQDGSVNLLDFSLVASKFGQTDTNLGRSDINGDGHVNLLDFSLLAAKFGH